VDNKSPKEVLEDDLGSYDIKKWRFYELRANYRELPSNSIYAEFPNTAEMAPGMAFWLIVKNAGKIINTGAGTSNSTDKEYAIAMHPGWNFVGNPFNFRIPRENIRFKSDGKIPELRFFSGEWNDPIINPIEAILPFEGYAVFDSTFNGDILSIDPNLSSPSNPLFKEVALDSENILWSVGVRAQCQEARDVDNSAAVVSIASGDWDELDRPEPLVIGEYVSVYFPHPEWNKLSKRYCTDFRPESADGYVWLFEVKTNISDKVNLSFAGLESVPDEFEIWLFDEAVNITQNLRETNHYAVAGSEQPKPLKLVIGKRDFIEEKLASVQKIPTTHELSQNFPNPFNPATTIRYGLPKAERVTLKIYNLLGEEVALIMNDELQAAGYHVAIWDGRNKLGEVVGSGIYIYRFRAGDFTSIKKMALLK
jgi:hypothetical protein